MAHKIRKTSGWKREDLHDNGIMFRNGKKFVDVHKAMGLYWIDYGIDRKNWSVLGTLRPVKTKREAVKSAHEAMKEFVLQEKR